VRDARLLVHLPLADQSDTSYSWTLTITQEFGMAAGTSRESAESDNRLLNSLLKASPRLRGSGECIDLSIGTTLQSAGDTAAHVYFPLAGVLSVILGTPSGAAAEAFTVGNEGMVGIAVWLGVQVGLESIVQQAPGAILRIPAHQFCRELDANRRTRQLLNHFAAYSLRFAYQNAVCNAYHSVEQRACRWLLSTAARARSSTLVMTQALLANMLGVRRQSVGEVAVRLQRAGVLVYRRNEITIPDLRVLEDRTCECYHLTRQIYRQIVEPLLS
jgi:CRP-like cAMP-binding protein